MDGQKKRNLLKQIQLGINYAQKNKRIQALQVINEHAEDLENDQEAILQFCTLCKLAGELDTGINILSTAVENNPETPALLNLYGILLIDAGRYHEADKNLRLAHDHSPDDWMNLLNLGITNNALKKYDEAQQFLEKAKALKPKHGDIFENLASCFVNKGMINEAIENARVAIKLQPKKANPYLVLGISHINKGEIDEAIKYTEKAIRLDEKNPMGYLILSTITSYLEKKPAIINKIEKILADSLPARDRSVFYFALGHMYDTKKDWDKAFTSIKQGNQLASTIRQENTAPKKHLKSLQQTYKSAMFEQLKPLGNESSLPLFIVGMPRSGTTLLEQIFASHSHITAGGENAILDGLLEIIGTTARPTEYQRNVNAVLNETSINEITSAYLDGLKQINPGARRITDKTLSHHFYLGLIQILFPRAPIIYISRSPLDICISCYFQHFENLDMGWSYKPEWIINTYVTFKETMSFWESVLPENRIFHIQYENLVKNPEQNIRELLDYCGLNWEPGCLEFYKTANVVKTASLYQVRQPINKQSVYRWKRYGTHIEPFANGLLKYLDNAEISALSDLGIKLKSKKWWQLIPGP